MRPRGLEAMILVVWLIARHGKSLCGDYCDQVRSTTSPQGWGWNRHVSYLFAMWRWKTIDSDRCILDCRRVEAMQADASLVGGYFMMC